MLNVLLVDDEVRILKHLQTEIPWTQLGLQLIGSATDGAHAMQLAAQTTVDIVITDIRMPRVDGLALCRQLRENNACIQIILISGYADFSYAQEAIGLGVIGYCLKPLNTSEVTSFLRTAVRNIRRENVLNPDALLDMIEGGNADEIQHALSELGAGKGPYYIAVSVYVHNIEKSLGATLSCKLGKHKYLYFSTAPLSRNAAVKTICYAQAGGIGMPLQPVFAQQLSAAVQDATDMAYQWFVAGKPTLCESLTDCQVTNELFENLKTALASPGSLRTFLQALQKADVSLLFHIRTAFRFYNLVYSSRLLCANGNAEDHYLYGYEQLSAEYVNFSQVLAEMLAQLRNPSELQNTDCASSGSFLQIIRYLNENYEKELSLKKIAEIFHMNASYISQLMKNETGLAYSQYVTELRINKAKELLQTTDLSLSEVSEAVGFNDYFYFIKKFKKEVGVTPGKF
ncbi:MAG: response regulator [Oscillospiraceae bacterium]